MTVYQANTHGYESNCYLFRLGDAVCIVDPSVPFEGFGCDLPAPTHVLLTHGHFDHILALSDFVERFHPTVCVAPADAELLTDPAKNASSVFGFPPVRFVGATSEAKDEIKVGDGVIRVLATPGHTAGSVCYLADGVLFSGDTLFECGYGRYDLYGGDAGALRQSLARLLSLPEDTKVYPGHGFSTTIKNEVSFHRRNDFE